MPPKSAPPASPSVTDTSSGEEEDEEQLSPHSIRPSATATAAPKPAAARDPPAAAARDPPAAAASASSSGEEESSSGEEGDEGESGSSEEETVERKQSPPPPTKIPAAAAESETESGSSDDSDSDANPPIAPRHSARVADPAVKPLASKPMTSAPNPPKPEPSSNKKRSIPPSPSESGAGQKAFQRIWSDEDEITILQGLISYNAKHGRIPFTAAGMDPYYDFIHDSLQLDISKSQLYDKLRRLKKKYENSRARSKGLTPSFSKQHDSVVYELSHKLWGEPMTESENGNAAHGDANRSKSKKRQRVNDEKAERIADDVSEDDDGDVAMLKGRYPYLMEALSGMGGSVQGSIMVKEAMEKIDESKAMSLESKLKKHKLAEARSHMRFMDLKKDSLKLVLDAVEKQG